MFLLVLAYRKHEILHAIEGMDLHISSQISLLSDDLSNQRDRIDEIDGRLRVIEKKQ
jgi:hypothetical protein